MESARAGIGLPSSSSFVRTTGAGQHSAEGKRGEEGGHTALYADWGEAEVALVGEVTVAGVAPCCGEDEVDHGGGEGGGGKRMAGL